jgi:SPP1 gp7 family putative phage head morphogenesis protein
MTTPRILAVTQKFRAQLIAHEDKATHAMNAGYQATLARINPALQRLYTQMVDALASGEQLPLSWLYEAQRLESLKRLVTNEISHYAALSQVTTQQLQHTGVQLGSQSAQSQLQASVPVGVHYAFGVPSPAAIANIVGVTQAGSPLRSLFDGFGAEAAKKVSDALIAGVSMGRNPHDVARDVQGALGISRNRALTVARTEMIRAYRSANLETFRANDDVCDGWIWTTALDRRVCAACIAMHGTKHSLDEELNGHPCCRCVMAPLTKSWDSILGPLGIDTSGIRETQQSPMQTGVTWFAQQSEETQRSILGSDAAYQLYAGGDASLEDFAGVDHDDDWGDTVYQKSVKQIVKGRR